MYRRNEDSKMTPEMSQHILFTFVVRSQFPGVPPAFPCPNGVSIPSLLMRYHPIDRGRSHLVIGLVHTLIAETQDLNWCAHTYL